MTAEPNQMQAEGKPLDLPAELQGPHRPSAILRRASASLSGWRSDFMFAAASFMDPRGGPGLFIPVTIVLLILVAWIHSALVVKRLRDAGIPAWYWFIFGPGPFVLCCCWRQNFSSVLWSPFSRRLPSCCCAGIFPEQATGMTMTATDPVALARDLLRCPSVTPAEGGALTVLERRSAAAGFTVHRMTFSDVGTPDVENFYARIGTQRAASDVRRPYRRGAARQRERPGRIRPSPARSSTARCSAAARST